MTVILLSYVSAVLLHLFDYLYRSDTVLTHVAGAGLAYALYKEGAPKKFSVWLCMVDEAICYLLWLVLSDGFYAIVSIWIFLSVYDNIKGFSIHEKATLLSVDSSVEKILNSPDFGLEFEIVNHGEGRYGIKTALRYVAFQRRIWLKQIMEKKAICFEDVSSVEEGCKQDIYKHFRTSGIEHSRCITLSGCGENSQDVVLIADNETARNKWLAALRQILVTWGDVRLTWFEKLLSSQSDSSKASRSLDDALQFLNMAGRPMSHKYAKKLFKKFTPNDFKVKFFECSLKPDEFRSFFLYVVHRPDISEIYERSVDRIGGKATLNFNQFHHFILNEQKEEVSVDTCKQWIRKYEPVLSCLNMSSVGFTNYILSEEQSILRRECNQVYQDMNQPLSHYFIATSHNTYLTKDQLRSKSQVEAYVAALKRGCKCVELDMWDGTNNEPIIYHGYTLTSKILVKDVLQAIKEYAFCVSRYPLILSFENHCSVEQQKIIAQYMNDILGDLIYKNPLPDNEECLPPPSSLQGYILVKSKKLKPESEEMSIDDDVFDEDDLFLEEFHQAANTYHPACDVVSLKSENDEDEFTSIEAIKESKVKSFSSLTETMDAIKKSIKTSSKEKSKYARELSDLVVYCQPTSFKGFEYAKQNTKYYEMVSVAEKRAFKIAKEETIEMMQFTSKHLCRIYPAGGRIDSSNYDPVAMWNIGCQLVALNYQTPCLEMQLNQGLFQDNGGCGYVLKPEFMRDDNITFDPRNPDETKFHTVKIRVISGHEIPCKNEKILKSERQLVVEVRIVGVDMDAQCMKTKAVKNNGFNPDWNEDLTFKIHVPYLAIVLFTVLTKEVFSAVFALPYRCMQRGYRRVPLWNKFSERDPHAYLFVHIDVEDNISE